MIVARRLSPPRMAMFSYVVADPKVMSLWISEFVGRRVYCDTDKCVAMIRLFLKRVDLATAFRPESDHSYERIGDTFV
jgi:hypothetical protein